MSGMQCPYCDANQEAPHGDDSLAEDLRHEHECSECEKTFVYRTQVSYRFITSKADCLNGSPHQLEFLNGRTVEYSGLRCKHCDYTRNCTEQEFEEMKI